MSSEIPRISLITAVYNNANHIEETIQSVLAQNYPNLEYIIIDGGSNDGTLEIIKKYQKFVHKFISEPDLGIYDALNKGIQTASGEVIGFLHSDDHFASSDSLHRIAESFVKNDVAGAYADLEYIKKNGHSLDVIRHWKSEAFSPALLKRGWMPPHPTLYLKKHVYDSVGLFNLNYKIAADYDMVLRVFSSPDYKFCYIPKVTVRMRFGGASNRNLKKILQKSSEDYKIAKNAGLPALSTLIQKNFSKLIQFFSRENS